VKKTKKWIEHYIEKYHKMPLLTCEEMSEYIASTSELIVPEVKPPAAAGRAVVRKGIAYGIKFDSQWELAFYIKKHDIDGEHCERNYTVKFPYMSADGKSKNFIPDFICSGQFYEIKGRWRPDDYCKQAQCPNVTFLDAELMAPIIAEVDKFRPNWRKDYVPI
jgi:hypothetical protein